MAWGPLWSLAFVVMDPSSRKFIRNLLLVFLLPLFGVAWIGLCLALGIMKMADPSSALLTNVSQAGVGLLVAYSIAIASITLRRSVDRDEWFGFTCGVGVAGFTGIVVGFAMGAYREAGHTGPLDQLGLIWSITTICALGGLIAFWPLIYNELNAAARSASDTKD